MATDVKSNVSEDKPAVADAPISRLDPTIPSGWDLDKSRKAYLAAFHRSDSMKDKLAMGLEVARVVYHDRQAVSDAASKAAVYPIAIKRVQDWSGQSRPAVAQSVKLWSLCQRIPEFKDRLFSVARAYLPLMMESPDTGTWPFAKPEYETKVRAWVKAEGNKNAGETAANVGRREICPAKTRERAAANTAESPATPEVSDAATAVQAVFAALKPLTGKAAEDCMLALGRALPPAAVLLVVDGYCSKAKQEHAKHLTAKGPGEDTAGVYQQWDLFCEGVRTLDAEFLVSIAGDMVDVMETAATPAVTRSDDAGRVPANPNPHGEESARQIRESAERHVAEKEAESKPPPETEAARRHSAEVVAKIASGGNGKRSGKRERDRQRKLQGAAIPD